MPVAEVRPRKQWWDLPKLSTSLLDGSGFSLTRFNCLITKALMGYATLKHQWPTPPSGPWQLLTSYFARMLISNSYWSLQNILLLDMWPDFPLHLSEFSCFYDRMPLFLIKPSYFKGECDGYLPISYSLLPHLPSWAHHPHGMPTVPFKRKLSLLQFSKQDFTPPRAVKSENPILSVYFITWRESLIFPPTVGWGFDLKLRIKE